MYQAAWRAQRWRRGPNFFKKLTTGGKCEEGNKGSLSKADQRQVKPGADVVPGEVPVDENTKETPPICASSQNNKSLKKPSLPPPAGYRGRFVEDIDPLGSYSDKKKSP